MAANLKPTGEIGCGSLRVAPGSEEGRDGTDEVGDVDV